MCGKLEPERKVESPEFEARYYPHYDYYDDDEEDFDDDDFIEGSMGKSAGSVDMSGFVAMEVGRAVIGSMHVM